MDPERSSKSTTELNDVTAVKETGDPLSTSSEGLFPSGVQEMDNANACQGQPKHLNYSHQPISQEKDKSGPGVESSPKVAENQPPNEDSDTDPNELEKLLGRGKRDGESREHLDHKKSGSASTRGNVIKSKLSLKIIVVFIVLSLTGIFIGSGVHIGFTVYNHQSNCHKIPSSNEIPIGKVSTVILLNTTNAVDQLTCYESTIKVMANFLVSVHLLPCQNLRYSNYTLVNHTSIEYNNTQRPFIPAFDDGYPNYLVDGQINMTVNVSTIKALPSIQEYIYFCLYSDYDQFQKVSRSPKSYWKNYSGMQCKRQQLSNDSHALILKDMFTIKQPDYVFVGIGSTVVPLSRFQFTINVSGHIISESNSGHSSLDNSTEDSCKLGDQQQSCELALNLTEALCIVASRAEYSVPDDAFISLTVEWPFIKPYKAVKITLIVMIASFVLGLILCLLAVILGCIHRRLINNTRGPIREEVGD